MAFVADDRVREASTTTGTGALTLGGAVSGYRAFSSVMADGDSCQYAIWLDNEWETGIGTYGSSGNTLTRTTVLSSSNSGNAVNFSAGSKQVVITLGARPRLGHPVFVPAGSASAPAVTTHGDDNTGVLFPSADSVAVSTAGTQRFSVDTAATTSTLPVVLPAGTAGAAALSTSGDLNTGVYFPPGGDAVAVTTGGTQRLTVDTAATTSTLPVVLPAGTAAAAALSTSGDLNTGVFFPAGGDSVAVTTGGTQRLTVDTAATTSTLPVVLPAGAVGAPALTASGDLNTGAWFPAADTVAVSTGGVEALRITSAQAVIVGNGDTAASPAAATIRGTDGTGSNVAGGNLTIRPGLATGNAATGAVIVQTASAGSSGSTLQTATERLRINASGAVIVGNGDTSASPAAATIRGTDATGTNNGGTDLTIQSGRSTGSANGGYIRFMQSVAGVSGTTLRAAAETARFDSGQRLLVGVSSANANGGKLQLTGGITFPASAVAATDSNTLDDYEEGSWTPAFSAASATFSYSVQSGLYTKIGKCVCAMGYIQLQTTGNTLNANNVSITGLPFTSQNVSGENGTFSIGAVLFTNLATTSTNMIALVGQNTTVLTLYRTGAAAASMTLVASNVLSATLGTTIQFSVVYQSDA